MEKEEVLKRAGKKKAQVGEMEKERLGKSSFIALLAAGVIAVAFMIVEGILRHFTAIYALGAVCYTWASVFYFLQYFLAKRPWQVLIGAALEGAAAIAMIVLYIVFSV